MKMTRIGKENPSTIPFLNAVCTECKDEAFALLKIGSHLIPICRECGYELSDMVDDIALISFNESERSKKEEKVL